MSGILRAAGTRNLQEVKGLVESGADVNEKDDNDNAVLYYAILSGSLEMVKYLIEHGADVNCENNGNGSPLHCAAELSSLEVVKYLVQRGAMVTAEDIQSQDTVLFLACKMGNDLIVDYLLQHGAARDIDGCDGGPYSPLSIGCCKGHTSVVQTLLKFNVDLRKEKELVCGNAEIIKILNLELKKSIKHRKKIQNLKTMDDKKLKKVI
jgi:ankyrin repeat protein